MTLKADFEHHNLLNFILYHPTLKDDYSEDQPVSHESIKQMESLTNHQHFTDFCIDVTLTE